MRPTRLLRVRAGFCCSAMAMAYAIPPAFLALESRGTAVADPTSQLLSIVPTASTCGGAPIPSECATAAEAVGPIISSFANYSILTAPEQAALLSWMAYESAEFKYNQNHFPAPGTPGQGTRNMMSPSFVQEYASSIPELAGQVAGKDPVDVLKLVQPDQYSFATAAWFYSTHCDAEVKQGVQAQGQAGWEAFITQCVGTTVDEGTGSTSRTAYWQRACQALGVATS